MMLCCSGISPSEFALADVDDEQEILSDGTTSNWALAELRATSFLSSSLSLFCCFSFSLPNSFGRDFL